MTKNKGDWDFPKRKSTGAFIGLASLVAFFVSYTISVRAFDWFGRSTSQKALILFGVFMLGEIFVLLAACFLKRRQPIVVQKVNWVMGLSILLLLLLISVYFVFYYEPVPFFTKHVLEIENVSDGDDDRESAPIEIVSISDLLGNQISPEEITLTEGSWIEEDHILVMPGATISISRSFIGAFRIELRAGPEQGISQITWDKDARIIDLAAQNYSPYTETLSASSWGDPNSLWSFLAILLVISDFVCVSLCLGVPLLAFLLNVFTDDKESASTHKERMVFTKIDIIILVSLCLLALILSLNLFGGHFADYTLLSGDAGNYASFAAAKTYPEFFKNDPLLSDVHNFDVYSTYHVSLTQLLAPLLGNFGSAFMAPQLVLTIMQLVGFYLLGRRLYRDRAFGILLTMFAFIFTQMNLSEFWGYVSSPIPRFSFQAILPFLLLFILNNAVNHRRWIYILGAMGLSVYFHLVSAPAWSVAAVISMWVVGSRNVPLSKRIRTFLITVIVFLIVIAPLVMQYFSKTDFGEVGELPVEEVYAIIDYRLSSGMVDFQKAIRDFIHTVLFRDSISGMLTLTAVGSFVFLNLVSKAGRERADILMVSGGFVGVCFVCIALPLIDFTVAEVLGRNPLQIQFLRAMRNIFPLLFIFFLYIFSFIYQKLKKHGSHYGVLFLFFTLCFVVAWDCRNDFHHHPIIARTVSCWEQGNVICSENDDLAQRADFFTQVRERTPIGARILSDDLAVRYYSLRPLAFSKKDGATFAFSNHAALLDWYPYARAYDELWHLRGDWDLFLKAYAEFGYLVDADYLVVERSYSLDENYPQDLQLVYSNQSYTLFKLGVVE